MNRATCGYLNSFATHYEKYMIDGMIVLHSKENMKYEM